MKKRYRVREERDFLALVKRGKKKESRFFKVFMRRNQCGYGRFAFVVSRNVDGRAVRRNTLRRRAREWIRTHTNLIKESYDVMTVFKKGASQAPRKELYEEFSKQFKEFMGGARGDRRD